MIALLENNPCGGLLNAPVSDAEMAARIVRTVAEYYRLTVEELEGPRRPERIAFPRQVAMWLIRSFTRLSLASVGEHLGRRDHGTVLHGWRTINDRLEICRQTAREVQHLMNLLGVKYEDRLHNPAPANEQPTTHNKHGQL